MDYIARGGDADTGDTGDTDPPPPLDIGEIVPRLQRFYGHQDWLNMPTPLLNAYIEMLPRLQAEENISAVTVAALGSGSVKQAEARRITRSWEASARSHGAPRAQPASTAKEMIVAFEAAGLTRG